jgi:hypothetical protein
LASILTHQAIAAFFWQSVFPTTLHWKGKSTLRYQAVDAMQLYPWAHSPQVLNQFHLMVKGKNPMQTLV